VYFLDDKFMASGNDDCEEDLEVIGEKLKEG
jgi:hypothetical protein